MPVWPKFVYTFGVSLRTSATRWKLRQRDGARPAQERTLSALTGQLAATSFWKQAGIEAGMHYGTFQARVPLHTHERIAPAVEQMKRGEADVLWPGRCSLFALTSGTSGGTPKCLPMTDDLLAHFRRAGFDALHYYTVRVGHARAFHGRHLFYGGTPTLTPLDDTGSHPAFAADVSGIAAQNFPKLAERHLLESTAHATNIPTEDAQIEAIAAQIRSRDITLIAGVPDAVSPFAQALLGKLTSGEKPLSHLQELWPNLECFVHSGASIAPHVTALRSTLGPRVAFHEIYAASEGFVAAQDGEPGQGLRVMADMGVFFEFVAVSDFDDKRLDHLGPKAVPLAGVKTGIDYVVLVTTPGGLARYVLGDVVRFISVAPPRLIHIGGTQLRLNAFSENVTEKDLTDALVTLCQRRGWTLVNFHVAPRFAANNLTGQQRGSHEWWVELKPGTVATPTGPQMAAELDAEFQRTNAIYGAKRATGMLEAPTVRLVMPGVFEHWLRFHQKWGGQHKMPRCRSDRVVADEFAHITNFAPE